MKLDELNAEMTHRFIDKIEVIADGSVNIHYKFTPHRSSFRNSARPLTITTLEDVIGKSIIVASKRC